MLLDVIAVSTICVMLNVIALSYLCVARFNCRFHYLCDDRCNALSSICVTALDVKWIHLILIKQQLCFCPLENNQGGFLTYAKQSDQINIL